MRELADVNTFVNTIDSNRQQWTAGHMAAGSGSDEATPEPHEGKCSSPSQVSILQISRHRNNIGNVA